MFCIKTFLDRCADEVGIRARNDPLCLGQNFSHSLRIYISRNLISETYNPKDKDKSSTRTYIVFKDTSDVFAFLLDNYCIVVRNTPFDRRTHFFHDLDINLSRTYREFISYFFSSIPKTVIYLFGFIFRVTKRSK